MPDKSSGNIDLPAGIKAMRFATYRAVATLEKSFPTSFKSSFIPMTAAY
jgi:hypothetical protein